MSAINNAQCACISAFLLSIGSAAYGAQPPDVVTSDGNGNTAMGSDALLNNSTGDGNTASGDSALNSNTTGSNNTASGIAALQSNTTGVNNTASGAYALGNNTIGFSNAATGAGALRFNSTVARTLLMERRHSGTTRAGMTITPLGSRRSFPTLPAGATSPVG